MGKSKIEWTDKTWNPIRAENLETGGIGHFCEHVSEGCRNCYAEAMQVRFRNKIRFARQDRDKVDIFLDHDELQEARRWQKPSLVFVCSMTDLFGDWVEDEWLEAIFAVMGACPKHFFQILTKREDRMHDFMRSPEARQAYNATRLAPDVWPPPNVCLGVSVEDQKTADSRIPVLLSTPAAFRNVSYEPALGPVDFTPWLFIYTHEDAALITAEGPDDEVLELPFHDPATTAPEDIAWPRLDQVIAGGESDRPGQEARMPNPAWFRAVRDQCIPAGVPFFLKQWGAWAPMDQIGASRLERVGDHRGRLYNDDGPMFDGQVFPARLAEGGVLMVKVGKTNAGRVLDGWIWDQMPKGCRPSADSDSGSAGPRESDQARRLL